ncbi:IS6 family transposase [Halomicrobium sp. LC1Hm]|uniref:IS6 family transposase n=1 Tax=Halomicrobium sp. LC1Hm TaxID=2610902 RepID=UPI0012985659|nr:IS6 family transposase [Halomicrobium sp. LC1Hm]
MQLADLLREMLNEDSQDVWENERTPTPVRRFGVRLHTAGLSIGETVAILELLGVDRSHGAVWNWVHTLSEAQSDPPTFTRANSRAAHQIASDLRTTEPSRVAVDEKQIEVDGEKKWLYAAIDTNSKLLLEIDVFSRRGTDPTAAFLHRLTEKHDLADTEFLVDASGYLTALARHELSGRLDYRTRNHIEKWFQTVTMRIDRFHAYWRGSQSSVRRWLQRFRHHYNHERPNQALDGRTPAQEVQN